MFCGVGSVGSSIGGCLGARGGWWQWLVAAGCGEWPWVIATSAQKRLEMKLQFDYGFAS